MIFNRATQYTVVLFFLGLIFSQCSKKESTPKTVEPPPQPIESNNSLTRPETTKASQTSDAFDLKLVKKGRTIYRANCTACHNRRPWKPGSLGPDLALSSKELLIMRVLDTKYPEGYKPKRKTKTMKALPHLKKHIPALHAYLNSNKVREKYLARKKK